MESSKLLTILAEVDEGHKTPFKAHNEILILFGVTDSAIIPKGAFCDRCTDFSPYVKDSKRCGSCGDKIE